MEPLQCAVWDRADFVGAALMKLLGHVNPEMTMRYVDVAGSDLQREFQGPLMRA